MTAIIMVIPTNKAQNWRETLRIYTSFFVVKLQAGYDGANRADLEQDIIFWKFS